MSNSPRSLAQQGFDMIKEATLDLLGQRPRGETAAELGKALGLHDSKRGGQNGYVVWTALGHLILDGKVSYDESYTLSKQKGAS